MLLTAITRLTALGALVLLTACAAPPTSETPQKPATLAGYEGVQDGEFFIEPVPAHYLTGTMPRAQVAFNGGDAPGTIVVDPFARNLYYVLPDGQAMRYTIAVGRTGLGFRGSATVNRKQEWPSWTPTANMVRTFPEMYAEYAGGLPGGLINPLGARALYLYRGGRDTYFRIHGTRENSSIGKATSAGCIRLFNQDAIDLYSRVNLGTKVRVRTREESERLEGKWIDNEDGYLIPYSEGVESEILRRKAAKEAADAAAKQAELASAEAAREAQLTGQPQG